MNQGTGSPVDAWHALARAASESSGVPECFLDGYLTLLEEVTRTGRRLCRQETDALRAQGEAAARAGVALADLTDLYAAASELLWSALGASAGPATATGVRSSGAVLLSVLRKALAALAEGHGTAQRSAVDQEQGLRQDFIDDLLHGRADAGSLAERADRYGLLLAGQHVVIVARSQAGISAARVARRIEVSLADRFGLRNVLVAVRNGLLVCIVPRSLRGGTGEFVHSLTETVGKDVRWQVGVGRPHSGAGGVLKSYEEARNVLGLADRLGFRAAVLHAADLLVFPVLLRDKEAITDLVTSVLGPLAGARGGPLPLLETLEALFACHGNTTATARRLALTPRAVAYRLDRIHHLTGYSPTEPTQRFTLEAAVLGARLLDWPERRS